MHLSLLTYTLWRQGIGSLCTVCWLIPLLGHMHVFPTWISHVLCHFFLLFFLCRSLSLSPFSPLPSSFAFFPSLCGNLPLLHILKFSILSIPFDFPSCFAYFLSISLSSSLGLSVLVPDMTSRPRSPPQPPPPPLPPGRPPPPTPPQERVTDVEAVGGGGAASGPEECEERERDGPLRQLEGAEAEEREGGRARAIDNQYSFFWGTEEESQSQSVFFTL